MNLLLKCEYFLVNIKIVLHHFTSIGGQCVNHFFEAVKERREAKK